MTLEQGALVVVAGGLLWTLGRLSSYGGWIRRVEDQSKDRDKAIELRVASVEKGMTDLGDSIAKRVEDHLASPEVSRKLAQNVAIYVVADIGQALADVKGNEMLRAVGLQLKVIGAKR